MSRKAVHDKKPISFARIVLWQRKKVNPNNEKYKENYYLIKIVLLSETNFSLNSLDSYNRKQNVNKVYRRIDGEYALEECKYTEDWDLNKKRSVAKKICRNEYITYIALEKSLFTNVKRELNFVCAIFCLPTAISLFLASLLPPFYRITSGHRVQKFTTTETKKDTSFEISFIESVLWSFNINLVSVVYKCIIMNYHALFLEKVG